MFFRDFVPRLIVSDLQSRMARQVPRMPWHPVPRRAFFAYLRYSSPNLFGGLTCSLLINLRLLISFIFYKESALFFGFYSGFTSGEYHIALVDFIVALRRTKGRRRRTLRSPSPPWNHACVVHWTPPPHPWEIRCGGAYLLPRVYTNLGFRYPVQTVCRHFDVSIGCLVFGLGLFAFQ